MTAAVDKHETDEAAVACYLLVLIDPSSGPCIILCNMHHANMCMYVYILH